MSNRTRALSELPALAQRTVELLTAPDLPLPFTEADVQALVPYLRLVDAPRGALLIAQGDRDNISHLLMLLEGEVSVDQLADGQPVQLAVLGAGGSARAIVHAMLEAGVGAVRVFNRTRERADVLARHFGARVSPHDWRDRVDRTRDVGLVTNTTVLGMAGASELVLPVGQLADSCVVADIVYVPLETPLLVAARARGLQGIDGLGMLLHQATPGFEKWFGVSPEVTPELRALVAADIGRT